MIIAKDLSKRFPNGKQAVKELSFHISEGETVGLIGANGAGKTTLIRLIAGFLKPDGGFIRLFEEDPVGRKESFGSHIGLVSGQSKNGGYGSVINTAVLQDELSVELNMETIKAIYKIPAALYRSRLSELSASLGLDKMMHYRADQLSPGQRMRAEFAAVLLYAPRLLILDEPFIGVDLIAREAIRENLKKLAKKGDTTIILTTHNVEEVEKICGRIMLMDQGNLVYNGSFDRMKYMHAGICSLSAELVDGIPDMQDLPILRYDLENNRLHVWYDSNIIRTRDITSYLLSQSSIKDLLIRKPGIEEIIRKIVTKNN